MRFALVCQKSIMTLKHFGEEHPAALKIIPSHFDKHKSLLVDDNPKRSDTAAAYTTQCHLCRLHRNQDE